MAVQNEGAVSCGKVGALCPEFTIMGKTVFKSEYSATSVGMLEIDSKLLKGIYLVKIVFEDNSADIHRLIID